jgi:two-component system sensor histidine kinase VicK
VAIDVLEMQLVSAVQRLATLQRRAGTDRDPGKLLERALKELEAALEEVRVAQEQIVDNRQRMEQLQVELTKQYEKYWELFDEMPQAYVVTRPDSTITEVNRAAAELFNVSQRFLVGKTLSVFVCENRSDFLTESMRVAREARSQEFGFKLRPRERAPIDVTARVSGDASALRWVLRPSETPVATTTH